jgi:hypothetical protein
MSEPQRIVTGTPTQAHIDSQRGYRMNKWKEFDNFQCLKCQFATLWLDKMLKHLQYGLHPWAYPSPEVPGQLSAPIVSEAEY